MTCPACATRLLRIFVHDTATTTLLLASSVYRSTRSIPHLPPYTRRIPISSSSPSLSIAHINRYSTTSTSSSPPSASAPTITREYRLWTQRDSGSGGGGNRRLDGPAYSHRRLSDDDYMPFITELPLAPPPLPPLGGDGGGGPMMSGVFPGVPEAPRAVGEMVEEDGVEGGGEGRVGGMRGGLETERRWGKAREKVVQSAALVRGGGRIRPGMAKREKSLREVRRLEEKHGEEKVEADLAAELVEEKVEVGGMEEGRTVGLEKEEIIVHGIFESTTTVAAERTTAREKVQVEAKEDAPRSRVEGRQARKERRIQEKMERLLALQAIPVEHESEEIKEEMKKLKQQLSKMLRVPVKKEDRVKKNPINEAKATKVDMDEVKAVPIEAPIEVKSPIPEEIEEHVKAQVVNAMKKLAADPDAPPPLDLPIRGNLPKTSAAPSQKAEQTKAVTANYIPLVRLRADKPKVDPDRPIYKNSWALPTSEPLQPRQPRQPRPSPNETPLIKSLERALLGPKPTPESILRNAHLHPEWLVQKVSLKKKLDNQSWRSHTRISPGTVDLIKSINAEAPNVLKAPEIARRFKISPESARRILHSKWTPRTDEEKDKRARKWIERGEKIRAALVERGDIWTKERKKANWVTNERNRRTREYMMKFGIKKGRAVDDDSGGSSVGRSLGKISWEGKFI